MWTKLKAIGRGSLQILGISSAALGGALAVHLLSVETPLLALIVAATAIPATFLVWRVARTIPLKFATLAGVTFIVASSVSYMAHYDGVAAKRARDARQEAEAQRTAAEAKAEQERHERLERAEAEVRRLREAQLEQQRKEEVERQERERKAEAERVEAKKKAVAEMQVLRKTNVDEYLRRLKVENMGAWVEEAKVLRPQIYAAHLQELRAANEAAELSSQRRNPVTYLDLAFNWSKGGFDNVAIVSFTIKSTLQFPVQDIRLACVGSGNSGTAIWTDATTLYEVVPAKSTKRIANVNMGFIPQQMSRMECKITAVR